MTPNPSKLRLKHPREPLLWNQVLLSDVCLPLRSVNLSNIPKVKKVLRRPIPSHHAREHKPTESSSVKICSRRRSFPQKFGYGTYDCIRFDNSTRRRRKLTLSGDRYDLANHRFQFSYKSTITFLRQFSITK
jgi:hypothetical protein